MLTKTNNIKGTNFETPRRKEGRKSPVGAVFPVKTDNSFTTQLSWILAQCDHIMKCKTSVKIETNEVKPEPVKRFTYRQGKHH